MTKQEAELLAAFLRNTAEKRVMILKLTQASAERFEREMDEMLAIADAMEATQ